MAQVYWKCMFVSNEWWSQLVGLKEGRHFFLRCLDDGYIDQLIKDSIIQNRNQYFEELAAIDPRAFAYWLTQIWDQEICDAKGNPTKYHPRKNYFVTLETSKKILFGETKSSL